MYHLLVFVEIFCEKLYCKEFWQKVALVKEYSVKRKKYWQSLVSIKKQTGVVEMKTIKEWVLFHRL